MTDTITSSFRTVKYRYSQLKDLHAELASVVDKLQLPIALPEFPGRKLFGATNKNEEAIIERKKELNNVMGYHNLVSHLFDRSRKTI